MTNERTEYLALTLFEALYLDDKLSLQGMEYAFAGNLEVESTKSDSLRGVVADARGVASKDLLLRIGSVIVELQQDTGSEVYTSITEKELWTLRECIETSARIGDAKVGLNLKFKVHKALQNFAVAQAVGTLQVTEEPNIEGWKSKLRQWEDTNASTDTDAN